jgi:PIN domain nuclease of toxin-antitoxin system
VGGDEVRFLLDTSVWLRGATEPETLPDEAREILGAKGEIFGLSAISLWEVGKKHQLGRLDLKKDLAVWLKEAVASHIQLMALTTEIVADAMGLPDFPKRDPGDELIVATARVHSLTLLTTDTKLKGYRHARIHYFTPVLEGK